MERAAIVIANQLKLNKKNAHRFGGHSFLIVAAFSYYILRRILCLQGKGP